MANSRVQRRIVAIATTLLFVAVGFLAQRHESEAAHAREQSGRVVHAQELADHHEVSSNAHLHGREAHAHEGDCSLLAMAHAPIVVAAVELAVAPIEDIALIERAASHDAGSIATYRFAPKTSPPRA